jgi:hypothetical protein
MGFWPWCTCCGGIPNIYRVTYSTSTYRWETGPAWSFNTITADLIAACRAVDASFRSGESLSDIQGNNAFVAGPVMPCYGASAAGNFVTCMSIRVGTSIVTSVQVRSESTGEIVTEHISTDVLNAKSDPLYSLSTASAVPFAYLTGVDSTSFVGAVLFFQNSSNATVSRLIVMEYGDGSSIRNANLTWTGGNLGLRFFYDASYYYLSFNGTTAPVMRLEISALETAGVTSSVHTLNNGGGTVVRGWSGRSIEYTSGSFRKVQRLDTGATSGNIVGPLRYDNFSAFQQSITGDRYLITDPDPFGFSSSPLSSYCLDAFAAGTITAPAALSSLPTDSPGGIEDQMANFGTTDTSEDGPHLQIMTPVSIIGGVEISIAVDATSPTLFARGLVLNRQSMSTSMVDGQTEGLQLADIVSGIYGYHFPGGVIMHVAESNATAGNPLRTGVIDINTPTPIPPI